MPPFESLPHQKLIDGLGYHVAREEIPRRKAKEIVEFYETNFPDDTLLDEGVLFQIRKDWGLAPQDWRFDCRS